MSVLSLSSPAVPSRRRFRLWWWGLIPILLLGFWLGAHWLDTRPVWGDEIHSIHDAGGDPDSPLTNSIWTSLAIRNPLHAPGYFYALNLWSQFTSWHPAIMRALSLMFGLLAIAVTARVASETIAPWAGLFAAAVLATSAFYVHYMVEMRVYSLIALTAAVDVWVYLRVVNAKKPPSRGLWLALLAAIAGTLYTHYMAGFTLIAIGLNHLLFVPKNRRWWQVVGVFALAGVLFLPWLSVFVRGYQRFEVEDATQPLALSPVQSVIQFFSMFGNDVELLPVALLILAATGLRRRNVRQILFLALAALAALVISNAFAGFLVQRRLRYLMPLWPLFALGVAVGWMQLRRWPALMAVLLALILGYGVQQSLSPKLTATLAGSEFNYPIHHVAEMVHNSLQEGDLVVSMLPDSYRTGTEFYTTTAHVYYSLYHAADKIRVIASDQQKRQIVGQDSLIQELEQKQRLWISYSGKGSKTLDRLIDILKSSFHRCFSMNDHPDTTVDLYVKEGTDCPSSL